jgi:hypothetical protein
MLPVAKGAEAPLDCADKPTCRCHAAPPAGADGAFGVGGAGLGGFMPGADVMGALVVLALVAAVARYASQSARIVLAMIMAVFLFGTWLLVTPPP